MLFEAPIHFVYIVHVPVAVIANLKFGFYFRHIQDRLDMIYLQQSHRLTRLPVGYINSFFFRENFQESIQRGKTPEINSRSGPVHNHT